MMDLSARHPAVQELMGFFAFDHLPPHLQAVSKICYDAAYQMLETVSDSAQLREGLFDLLRAKDCFVRAALIAKDT